MKHILFFILTTVLIANTSAYAACCKVCSSSQACGDTCISFAKICDKPPGCACSSSFNQDDTTIQPIVDNTDTATVTQPVDTISTPDQETDTDTTPISTNNPSYDTGFLDGKNQGIAQCKNNPASCGITLTQSNEEPTNDNGAEQCLNIPAITTDTDNSVDSCTLAGRQQGISKCFYDPESCGIKVNQNNDGSTNDGITQCKNAPESCGITINYNNDGSTNDGVAQCKNNPKSCGITSCETVKSQVETPAEIPKQQVIYYPLEQRLYIPSVSLDGEQNGYSANLLVDSLSPMRFTLKDLQPVE